MMEAFVFGAPVVTVMLGVPIWRSISDCRQGRSAQLHLIRWWLVCGGIIFFSMLSGLVFGVAGFVLSNLPPPASPPKASQLFSDCKILSSGVDLRWSKICTPRSLSSIEDSTKLRSRFRCFFEYYWTCVLKVEFKAHSSEDAVKAWSQIPKAALPAYCRPAFGQLWILKEKYQVNETYPCRYQPGHLETVDIAGDLFAKCKSEKVTALNLFKQAIAALLFSDQWIFSSRSQAGIMVRKVLSHISYAAFYSMFITGIARTVCTIRMKLYGSDGDSNIDKVYFEVRAQLTCIIMANILWAVWNSGHMEDLILFIRGLLARTM